MGPVADRYAAMVAARRQGGEAGVWRAGSTRQTQPVPILPTLREFRAELMAASPRVVVRRRQGRKGEDFDLTAVVMGMPAEGVPVEVKAKADTTAYTDTAAARTVKKAAAQLPRGKKGLLFVRVPTGWVSPRLEEAYVDALAEDTRQTSRLGAVVRAAPRPRRWHPLLGGAVPALAAPHRHHPRPRRRRCPARRAGHGRAPGPRTTRRYDHSRGSLDRHPTYALTAYLT